VLGLGVSSSTCLPPSFNGTDRRSGGLRKHPSGADTKHRRLDAHHEHFLVGCVQSFLRQSAPESVPVSFLETFVHQRRLRCDRSDGQDLFYRQSHGSLGPLWERHCAVRRQENGHAPVGRWRFRHLSFQKRHKVGKENVEGEVR